MVKVKVCGITNLQDARKAIACGADALGFVFYKKSRRYIKPAAAGAIIRKLPKGIIKVGVFVGSPANEVCAIAGECGLDMLQFHGNESEQFCARFKGYKIIKAFRIKEKVRRREILKYKTFAYLFDAYAGRRFGGTGKTFSWKLLEGLSKIKKPIFLAGGLTAENVAAAIRAVGPGWVDVSSSVETRPGKKDYKKIKDFIEASRQEA